MTTPRLSLAMTPRARKIAVNVSALVGALVTTATCFGPPAVTWVDTRYVHQVPYDKLRILDSLNYRQDVRDIRAMMFHLDSEVHRPRPR